ncbi:ATP-binding domain-containing protein [Olsenella sp. HMSC062G07]|uniref:HelD family protein n=1 Tax=Olsenella sp. HMSC062G07 TaxID=1739330 RepID=UPI0008A5777B|nr:ATP-binding domain-containing protein [Olsenella sp. HMSC062G07]OFK23563.1 DNA helicase [Olsenella sp. HMSC062G07]
MQDLSAASGADLELAREQAHLSDVYAQLVAIRDRLNRELEVSHRRAAQDLRDMSEEVRRDFSGDDETMETLAAIETLNAVIDAYNQAHDFDVERLTKVLLLLGQPYFAKVSLRYPDGRDKDVYLGAAGVINDRYESLVVDWRSPIAETYYNQKMGPCTYEVKGRDIACDVRLRRQFDIRGDRLNAYFDTTVAIQDSLLLAALKHNHSPKLKAVTATIQREQNEVVRHEDVSVLLVSGIAGSGKTSVLLQRIAFLLYQQKDTLDASQVYLFTPNAVFESYIDAVLPSLGERNPHILTWREFVASLGLASRALSGDGDADDFARLEAALPSLELEPQDFKDLRVGEETLLKAAQCKDALEKFPRVPLGARRCALAIEDLHERLDRKLAALSRKEELRDELLSLDLDEQIRIFGTTLDLDPSDKEELDAWARRYVDERYGQVHEDIERAAWLDVDHLGRRILGVGNLNAAQWLYTQMLLTGGHARDARFVMVDEVQDYTATQLMLLARYFGNAHFLLLGDEHQAIKENSASFDEVRAIFGAARGPVEECRLLTSYRSSPEITELFTSLLRPDERQNLNSVQREGVPPVIRACPQDREGYLRELGAQVELAHQKAAEARDTGENFLTAVVAADKPRANWLRKQLGPAVRAIRPGEGLPATGVVVLDLALAKGLEFDQVIIPDAQAETYPATELARRRLYTAISRAMHQVVILSQGAMTPLLSGREA